MASLQKATPAHQLPADFNQRCPDPQHLIWPADKAPPVMVGGDSKLIIFKKATIDVPVTVDTMLKAQVREKVWLQLGTGEQDGEQDFYFDRHVVSYRSTVYSLGYVVRDEQRCNSVRQVFRFIDSSSDTPLLLILWLDMHDKDSYAYKYTYTRLIVAADNDRPVHIRGFPRLWKEIDGKSTTLFRSISVQCVELDNLSGHPISSEDVSIFPRFTRALLA